MSIEDELRELANDERYTATKGPGCTTCRAQPEAVAKFVQLVKGFEQQPSLRLSVRGIAKSVKDRFPEAGLPSVASMARCHREGHDIWKG